MNRINDLKYFNELREKNIWCNAILISKDNKTFAVHTPILMANSDYFSAAFQFGPNNGKKGTERSKLQVLAVTSDVLESIIRYMYIGEIELNNETLWSLLNAADYLQIPSLYELCIKFLQETMCFSTCNNLIEMTHSQNLFMPSVYESTLEYALANICNPQYLYADRKKFIEKIPKKLLLKLLGSNKLNAPYEELVWEAIDIWVSFIPDERECHLEQLLKQLRLGRLLKKYVFNQIMQHPLIKTRQNVLQDLVNRENIVDDYSEHIINGVISDDMIARQQYEMIIVFGGWANNGPCNECFSYDINTNQWLFVPEIMRVTADLSFAYHGFIHLGKYLYIIGGVEHHDSGNHDNARCYKIDLETFLLETMCPLSITRNFVNVTELNGMIYAIGGRTNGTKRLNSGEKYNPTTNEWTNINPMLDERSDAGIVVVNNKIYVIGGFNGKEVLKSAEVYDPEQDTWNYVSNLNCPRSGLCCAVVYNNIYAIGGYSGSSRVASVERYNIEKNEWKFMTSMNVARSNMKAVTFQNWIIVIGGYSEGSITGSVEVYDVFANKWFTLTSLPTPRSALNAVIIKNDNIYIRNLVKNNREIGHLLERRQSFPPQYYEQLILPEGTLPNNNNESAPDNEQSPTLNNNRSEEISFTNRIASVFQTFIPGLSSIEEESDYDTIEVPDDDEDEPTEDMEWDEDEITTEFSETQDFFNDTDDTQTQ